MTTRLALFLPLLATALTAHARLVEYDLTVAEQAWSPGDGIKPVPALILNGGIPGPTLRFREGDTARIRVHNHLKNEETSIQLARAAVRSPATTSTRWTSGCRRSMTGRFSSSAASRA